MNNNMPTAPSAQHQHDVEQHEHDVEEREAYQYWGYLFKPDKTGTDKLKSLLRGLKEVMNKDYEPTDNPDLTPTQLAHFYRELDGNYDQLFLGTPSESIAFIYKSLGCLYSLQPLPQSTAFTEPTVPALKTEGWIMWQTIQLLLGPEEHSSFLREAIQKWDVRDPVTREAFPKILPRQCFPMEPDKHMVAWYEGVSERLRKEAEEEERHREIEAEQAEVRRIQYRKQREDEEDSASVDSRGPAMAYFRNPLYRQDGRPTIVRGTSKRPQLSPRRSSMKDKAKDGAASVGHVIRNIGSPHLWDGRGGGKSESRDRSKDHRRRSSLPDNRHHYAGERPLSGTNYDTRTPSHNSSHHRRARSGQHSEPGASGGDENQNSNDEDPASAPDAQQNHQDADPALRHSKSHEPTPSQKDYNDYFENYDDPNPTTSAGVTPNGIGPSFTPSASPLFASHVAQQPQPHSTRPPPDLPAPPRGPPPDVRRAQRDGRPYSRSPDPTLRPRSRDNRRHGSRERRRHGSSPGGRSYQDRPPSRSTPPTQHQSRFPPMGGGNDSASAGGRRASNTLPYPTSNQGYAASIPVPERERRGSRSGRMSTSEFGGGPDDGPAGGRRNGPPPKQTRFAQGVDGRKYPDDRGYR